MERKFRILVEDNKEDLSLLTEQEIEFLTKNELIEIHNNNFYPKFVGEFSTPGENFFSLPKNFNKTNKNISIIEKVLTNYKDLTDENQKSILINNRFKVDQSGDVKSEKYYYTQLRDFFLDYITYEYIYPKKRKTIHSRVPIKGGRVDPLKTEMNRKRLGAGITYKVKDFANNDDWLLDDIYFYTIKYLAEKYASDRELKSIHEMKDFLDESGYNIKSLERKDKEFIIKNIEKCEVGIIHNPIKNTLLDFWEFKTLDTFKIKAFYSKHFQFIWEDLCRTTLKHDDYFKEEIERISKRPITISIENDEILDTKELKLYPDVFSRFKGKWFVGDAKYYKDYAKDKFEKELYSYNVLIDNKYPLVILIPNKKTTIKSKRKHIQYELLIIHISVEEAIEDAIKNSNRTLNKIHKIIEKNSKRSLT